MVRLPRAAANTDPVGPLVRLHDCGPHAFVLLAARTPHMLRTDDDGIGSGSMADRQFAISGKWALAADRLQWMVQRQYLQGRDQMAIGLLRQLDSGHPRPLLA
jgi:hypothetical protein